MSLSSPAPETLRLPRLEQANVRACNTIAQRVSALTLLWEDRTWQLTLRPRPDPMRLPVGDSEWCVRFSWDGVPFELALPSGSAQAWLGVRCPGLDLPQLPDSFVAAVLERACGSLTGVLASQRRAHVQVDQLVRGAGGEQGLAQVFDLEAVSEGKAIRARLSTDSLGLALLADRVAHLNLASRDVTLTDLPIRLRAELGATWLDVERLSQLQGGDVILVEHPFGATDQALWVGCSVGGFQASVSDACLTVQTLFGPGVDRMRAEEESPQADHDLASLDRLPLRVVFDLGEVAMTLGELRELQVGQTLDLGRTLSQAVQVRVNGALLATGELVEIDGRLGVTLSALSARPCASPAGQEAVAGPMPAAEDRDEPEREAP